MNKEKPKSVVFQTLKIYWNALKKYKFYAISSTILIAAGTIINGNISPWVVSDILNKIQAGVDNSKLFEIFMPQILLASGLLILSELIIWRAGIWILWKKEMLIRKHLYEMVFLP